MSSYVPLAYWSSAINNSKEGWYVTPGTSPYELNMNVSVDQGPAWGPKGSVHKQSLVKHSLSMSSKIALAVLFVIIIFALHYISHKKYSESYF